MSLLQQNNILDDSKISNDKIVETKTDLVIRTVLSSNNSDEDNDDEPQGLDKLCGMKAEFIAEKLLDAIDKGVSTDDIRKDPFKYIISGKTMEIVINRGGNGLKICPEIIQEMASRGDKAAKYIIEKNDFMKYSNSDLTYTYFNHRTNKTLIEIIKEDKLRNTGGMTLCVCQVYVEPFTYTIREEEDRWGSEYIDGWHKEIASI
jgi:methyltransferase-like protein